MPKSLMAECVLAAENRLGESPVWVASENALYWVDIPKAQLHRFSGEGHATYACGNMVGTIALAQGGGFVAATETGFSRLKVRDAGVEETAIAPFLADVPAMRMNDGALDRDGRFWAGSIAHTVRAGDPVGALFRLSDTVVEQVCDGLLTQNGLAFSPEGTRLYLSDSFPGVARIWTFSLDRDTGAITDRALFADQSVIGGRPDGAAVDVAGCYWIAASDSGRVVRLTPRCEVDAEIVLPVSNPTNVCFGGSDLRTMFITSQRMPGNPEPFAGGLFAIETPWQGLPETPFQHQGQV